MLVSLVEVRDNKLSQISINPNTVAYICEDQVASFKLGNKLLPEGLDSRTKFTRIFFENGKEIVVVGAPVVVKEKINHDTRTLLKG